MKSRNYGTVVLAIRVGCLICQVLDRLERWGKSESDTGGGRVWKLSLTKWFHHPELKTTCPNCGHEMETLAGVLECRKCKMERATEMGISRRFLVDLYSRRDEREGGFGN